MIFPDNLRAGIALFAIMLSFACGYFVKGQFVLAEEAVKSRVVIKDSAKGIVTSVKESARIEQAVASTDTNINQIKAAVKKRGVIITHRNPSLENCHVDTPIQKEGPYPDYRDYGGPYVLDLGTVGLLNAAREGRTVESAGSSDEAQSAPSTIGVSTLVDNDLEIVRMYHDLAKRHDELVDAVEKKLQEQAQ